MIVLKGWSGNGFARPRRTAIVRENIWILLQFAQSLRCAGGAYLASPDHLSQAEIMGIRISLPGPLAGRISKCNPTARLNTRLYRESEDARRDSFRVPGVIIA